ncbi:hypothetical protein IT6_06365 [Methylacidiphilum caldifontis]|uniref:hypothetical protein n=1 Tax=Methylacidiphilum caldifontis TaxID=2795386 RepID=UPI001A8C8A7B|nr:hypothetical protein [Methylacidiphilum caldifontis]QSR88022.1 hypothetical protein IT6_06365 [Methylacidiphilum caldifontis]
MKIARLSLGQKISLKRILPFFVFFLYLSFTSAKGEEIESFINKIDEFSKKSELSKEDCLSIAQSTIDLGKKNQIPPGVIEDGIKAVELGKRLDPHFAPWEDYLQELLRLLKENSSSASSNKNKKEGQSREGMQEMSSFEPNFRKGTLNSISNPSDPRNLTGNKHSSSLNSLIKEQKKEKLLYAPKNSSSSSTENPSETNQNQSSEHFEWAIKLRQIKQLDSPSTFFKRMRQIESETNETFWEDPDW